MESTCHRRSLAKLAHVLPVTDSVKAVKVGSTVLLVARQTLPTTAQFEVCSRQGKDGGNQEGPSPPADAHRPASFDRSFLPFQDAK